MKCTLCKNQLNEFDVAFHKHFKYRKADAYACTRCNTNLEIYNDFKKLTEEAKKSKKAKEAVLPKILSCIHIFTLIGAITVLILIEKNYIQDYTFLAIFGVPHLLCNLEIAFQNHDDGTTYTRDTGYHYESEMDSDGKVITRKVTDTSSYTVRQGPTFLGRIITSITLPLWGWILIIYEFFFDNSDDVASKSNRKFIKKKYTEEVADAFIKANKEAPIALLKANIKHQKYSSKTPYKKYQTQKEEITKKYSVLSQEIVEEKIKELKPPFTKTKINGKPCIVVFSDFYSEYEKHFILIKNNNNIQGCVIDKNFFLVLDEDWLSEFLSLRLPEDLHKLLLDKDVLADIERQLNQ